MAITQAGTTLEFTALPSPASNTGTVSTTITVPADAEIAVVGWAGFSSTSGFYSTGSMTLTKGGVDTAMTFAGCSSEVSNYQAIMFYLVLPDTGANKTLKWDWAGAGAPTDTSSLCSITFWKGIDTASPVRNAQVGTGTNTPYTAASLTALTGDLIVAWVGAFATGAANGSIDSWSNLTLLNNNTNRFNADGAWATGSPTGNTIVAASTDTSLEDGGIVAISLKAASTTLYLRPDADSIDGSWTNELGGTTLFSSIDETVASDTDYIQSSINPVADIAKISLSDPASGVGSPVIVSYRYKKRFTPTASLTVRLLQGVTQITSWSHSDISSSFVTTQQTLSAPELASITDFTDLYLEFTANS